MSFSSWTIEQTSVGRVVVPSSLPPGLALLCTTSDFAGYLDDSVAERLLRVLRERFEITAGLATCEQVHGAAVVHAGNPAPGSWREAASCDGLVTRTLGVALGVKAADCLPVTIVDTDSGALAGIHSGWRGAAGRIVPAAIDELRRGDGFDTRRARAFLGPSIRACCFEVGEEVVDALRDSYGAVDEFVDRARGEKPHVDLPGLTRRLLLDAGFDGDAIDDSGLCTRCDGSIFHSYRRDGSSAGRNLSIAVLA
ncbi:MAG: polyphenol oxidase family protein [Thermoanaerobaculia bacterium]